MPRGRPRYPGVLTPREQEVLEYLRRGLTNEQIAQTLGISESGARYHVSEILTKLGVSRREDAANWQDHQPNTRKRLRLLLPFLSAKVAIGSIALAALLLIAIAFGVVVQALRQAPDDDANAHCPVTAPNGSIPPGESQGSNVLGNGAIWVGLYPNGEVQFEANGPGSIDEDGSMEMKFWWWHAVSGKLQIEGHRLDGAAPPLLADIPDGYGDTGFQAAGLIFSSPGCWSVTGRVGQASLNFVTLVSLKR